MRRDDTGRTFVVERVVPTVAFVAAIDGETSEDATALFIAIVLTPVWYCITLLVLALFR